MKSKVCENMIEKCNDKLNQCEQKPITCEEKPVCAKPINKCKPTYGCQVKEMDYSCKQSKKKSCNPCNQMPSQNYCNPCNQKTTQCNDDIIYVEDIDLCNNTCASPYSAQVKNQMCDSTYVSPMYDMCPMQYISGFYQQYPTMDMPNMNSYVDQYQDINDMWMNYYNMVQGMMMQNIMPPSEY